MYRLLSLVALLLLIVVAVEHNNADARSSSILRIGSEGSEVKILQQRLKTLGYYKLAVDSQYGKATRNAVQRFQKKNRIVTNGLVGPHTWSKINNKAAIKTRASNKVSNTELSLLARIIHAEAKGESYKGQVAVGAVIMNRMKSPQFPKTLKGVIYQPNAFSVVRNGQYKKAPSPTAVKAARAALQGTDPTNNALFFYNPKISKSSWFKSRPVTKKIGNHQFTM
ncbi:cell wall hydrolase [Paenibacillus abyssi]|uniref:Spore cortex-lytic enzyme n=1 Tax=Paenibacillus abyssi TaxID=1340531 RepID=A0A917FQL5_9BACL|nr:cell wall hydrolase [Paenibacillus abyssi]GGF95113.1 spore cortex-lytic enzyme [Paenibacillus abyssi]